MHDKMVAFILECFGDLIAEYNLTVSERIYEKLFTIDLENQTDVMYICCSTHPSDSPFSFDVRYCKQKFIDKRFVLYRTDTRELTTLWRFDKHLNTAITGSLQKDMPIISECCKRASEMFIYFQAMSDAEYYNVRQKL